MSNRVKIIIDVDDKGSVKVLDQTRAGVKGVGTAAKKSAGNLKPFNSGLVSAKSAMIGIGAAVVGIVAVKNAIAAMARVGGQWMALAKEQIDAEKRLNAVLKATQGAAGLTAGELKRMASSFQDTTNFGDELVISGQAIMLTFKNIKKDAFEPTMRAALDMSVVMEQDLKSSLLQVGKAMNDPLAGMSALQRSGVTFTESQKDMVKQMAKTGNIMGAQKIILKELQSQFGGAAAASKDAFVDLEMTYGDHQETLGKILREGLKPVVKEITLWIKQNDAMIQQNLPEYIDKATRAFRGLFEAIKLVAKATGHAVDGFQIMVSILKSDVFDAYNRTNELFNKFEDQTGKRFKIPKDTIESLKAMESGAEGVLRPLALIPEEINKIAESISNMPGMTLPEIELELELDEHIAEVARLDAASRALFDGWVSAGQQAAGQIQADISGYLEVVNKSIEADKLRRDTYVTMLGDMEIKSEEYYQLQEDWIQEQVDLFEEGTKERVAAEEWATEQLRRLDEDKIRNSEKTMSEIRKQLKDYVGELGDGTSGIIGDVAQAWASGEDAKVAASRTAAGLLSSMAGSAAQGAFDAAIEPLIDQITAWVGLGAAEAGTEGGGGWAARIGNIAMFLAQMGIGIAGSRAAARNFADGGWISNHPRGGVINAGSGIADDVFLGNMGNTSHYGMGGEYVINRHSTASFLPLLEMINGNKGYASGGYLRANYDSGGLLRQGDWVPTSEKLAAGGAMAFGEAFGESKNIWAAIVQAILYHVAHIGATFSAKNSGSKVAGWMGYAGGGILDGMKEGGGTGGGGANTAGFFDDLFDDLINFIIDPLDWLTRYGSDHIGEWLGWVVNPFGRIINAFTGSELSTEDLWNKFISFGFKGFYKSYAEDIIDPSVKSPLDAYNENGNAGEWLKGQLGLIGWDTFHQGGVIVETGEGVVSRKGMDNLGRINNGDIDGNSRPIVIHLTVPMEGLGKTLRKTIRIEAEDLRQTAGNYALAGYPRTRRIA